MGTHIAFGVLVWLLLVGRLELGLIGFAGVLIGSVLPDIDCSFSKIGRKWYVRIIMWTTKHRGVLHSLIFALAASWLVWLWRANIGIGLFVGYIGHLFLDCLTLQGVGLFWPFKFKIKGGFKTGKYADDFIFIVCIIAIVFLFAKAILKYIIV